MFLSAFTAPPTGGSVSTRACSRSSTAGGAMCAPGGRGRSALLADATKGVVCAAAAMAAVAWRGRATGVLAGALANAATAKVLKRVVNAPRPTGSGKTDAGMPSSHAASLFFLARAAGRVCGPAGAAALLCGAVVACAWRVRCGYHSVAQVCAGTALGVANEAVWGAFVMPAVGAATVAYAGGVLEIGAVAIVLVIGFVAMFKDEIAAL